MRSTNRQYLTHFFPNRQANSFTFVAPGHLLDIYGAVMTLYEFSTLVISFTALVLTAINILIAIREHKRKD